MELKRDNEFNIANIAATLDKNNMEKYIVQVEKNCKLHGEYIALKSSAASKGITYNKLWDYSGRLYAYLKDKNISKEDFVLICLPRGVRALVAIVGIIRAGAAFTIVESTYAKDRIEYIKNDCNCKLVLDEDSYAQAMTCDSLDGYENTDPHDACFAVYTSGSTGNPKGVLHEYGKLEQMVYCQKANFIGIEENAVGGDPSPLNFVASILIFLGGTYFGACMYVIPYDAVKDIKGFVNFIEENNISVTFMTCSLIKLIPKLPSCLKRICLGSEPCNGIYDSEHAITNSYAASETAFTISIFEIDKMYDVTPVGKNLMGIKIQIVDDDGNVLNAGETGEICVYNEFTRGYINLPEKTKEVFIDKMYHTNDIGYLDENGNLIVKGRKDDMIKINGNRIEPAEIESAIKNVLNVKNVVAKGFNVSNRSYICSYLLESELAASSLLDENNKLLFSSEEMGKKLIDILPYYMIPTYYVVLKSYPLNANGKIARIKLEAPEIDNFREEYAAPSNDTEKYLCELISEILGVEKVSVNDDFYTLGGDSLASVTFVSKCELKGLTAADIYKYRSVKKISDYYIDYLADNDIDINKKNIKALEHEQILLSEMETVIESQELAPDSIMWNLPFLFKLKKDIDLNKLANAIDTVFKHHPIYNTVIKLDDYSMPRQKYDSNIYENIKIIELKEEEFLNIKDELIKPFNPYKQPYLRKAIYKTEDNAYLFMDHYHIITDGTSLDIIFKQITNVYNDENYELAKDYYYLMLREEEKSRVRGEFEEIKKYYKQFINKYFDDKKTMYLLAPDCIPEDGSLAKSITYEADLLANPKVLNANRGILSENEFFIVCVLLAMAKYNKQNSSYIQWVFNGRDSKEKMDMAGLLYRSLPVAACFDENKTLKEYYEEVVEQVRYSVAHNTVQISSINYEFNYSLFFLFQKNIVNKNDFPLAESRIEIKEDETADSTIEMMVFADMEDKYYCTIEYESRMYKADSIVKFFNLFNEISNKLSYVKDINDIKISDILK